MPDIEKVLKWNGEQINQLHHKNKKLEERVEAVEKELEGVTEWLKQILAEVTEINQSLTRGYKKL